MRRWGHEEFSEVFPQGPRTGQSVFCPGGIRPPHQVLRSFVDEHWQSFGVESICKVLHIAPSGYWRHAAVQRNPALRSGRSKRDDVLAPQVQRVWQANLQGYGTGKVWVQMDRPGIQVARCTVDRLMQITTGDSPIRKRSRPDLNKRPPRKPGRFTIRQARLGD